MRKLPQAPNCAPLPPARTYTRAAHRGPRAATDWRRRAQNLSRLPAIKPLAEFPFPSRTERTRHWICLACQRVAARSWYLARVPDARRLEGYGTFVRELLAERVHQYLSAHPCVDCGEENIALLDFDHLRDKTADVSSMIRDGASWELIAEEIAKCDVRCANCHARVTALRIGAYKFGDCVIR